MSHKRVKNIDYDDDDLDDYDEAEEEGQLNADEQAQMRQGVQSIKASLGKDYDVDNAFIEETLYYYYFDVAKSLDYIKKQKKSKPSQATHAQGNGASEGLVASIALSTPPSTRDLFADISWSYIPPERLGNISVEPLFPRGRLLGGSGKPSKLAALAAQKKKAQEDRKKAEAASTSQNSSPAGASSATALLDKLTIQGANQNPAPSATGIDAGSASKLKQPQSEVRRYKRQKVDDEQETSAQPESPTEEVAEPEPEISAPRYDLKARPSQFATTLFGKEPVAARDREETFTVPNPSSQNPFADPSPDEVVRSAQARGQSKKKPDAKPKAKDDISQGVAAMQVDDAPKVKSKNLDVVAEFARSSVKKSANFVVVGHVDHGKSTLMGRLLYDLGHVDERSHQKMQKSAAEIGKSSFAFAWAMDSTDEERERGITVDIATNTFETSETIFTILDAPGHKDFVPNMIAGASQADFAVLVVDASTNAFEAGLKGQTREHALLVRSMGISRVIVAVNKMDSAEWNQDRFNSISEQLSTFLIGAGFKPEHLTFVPCAGLTGDNVAKPPKENIAWYGGGTLVNALDASEPARRRLSDPLRMTISDVIRTAAPGMTADVGVIGRLDAGNLQIGTVVVIQPAGEAATVKSIEVDQEPRDWAVAGQIANVGLVGIDEAHLRSGDVLCERGKNAIQTVRAFTAKFLAFDHIVPGPVEVYRGRLSGPAQVADLIELLDKGEAENGADAGSKKKRKPRVIKPGNLARLRVAFEADKALPLEAPDRVVLRAEGSTIAAGLIDGVELK